jgi:hypothetical protein
MIIHSLFPTSLVNKVSFRFNGKKSKEIWDFEIFDKASRGAWGSVLLLFRTKGRSLAALGAILTLLLIANDSFYQQVVNMREDWSEGGIGSAAAVIKYNPEYRQEFRGGIKQAQQDPNLYSTLLKYFYANGKHKTTTPRLST